MKNRYCYNSGKITGLPYIEAQINFLNANGWIRLDGYIPINPMTDGLPRDRSWLRHMIYDIKLLLKCEAIYLQPNWKDSRGAKIEVVFAILFNKEIL